MSAEQQPLPERPYSSSKFDLANLLQRYHGTHYNAAAPLSNDQQSVFINVINGFTFTDVEDQLAKSTQFLMRVEDAAAKSPEDAVNFTYKALLNREPDGDGMQVYTDQLSTGRHISEVVEDIKSSGEYRSRMVTQMYHELLEREPDQEGLKTYTDQLEEGKTVEEISADIMGSDEHRQLGKSHSDKIVFFGKPVYEAFGNASTGENKFLPKVIKMSGLEPVAKGIDKGVTLVKNVFKGKAKS